jgi:hypothetical protein
MPHFKYSNMYVLGSSMKMRRKESWIRVFFAFWGGCGGGEGWGGLNAKGDKERKPLDKQILTGC